MGNQVTIIGAGIVKIRVSKVWFGEEGGHTLQKFIGEPEYTSPDYQNDQRGLEHVDAKHVGKTRAGNQRQRGNRHRDQGYRQRDEQQHKGR